MRLSPVVAQLSFSLSLIFTSGRNRVDAEPGTDVVHVNVLEQRLAFALVQF